MNSSTILTTLKSLGYESIPSSWYQHISDWDAWYRGSVPDFHDYTVFNGMRHVRCRKLTAGMAKNIAESWADLLMNATLSITLEGKAEQEFFDAVCASNNFRYMMNLYEEYTFALGTSAIVLRLTGVPVDANGNLLRPRRSKHYMPEIAIDFVRADGIFPLSWENGVIRECAFATSHTVSGWEYLYLQLHLLQPDSTYRIENRLYTAPDSSSDTGSDAAFLTEVSLDALPATKDIAPVFLTQSPEPLFFINTPNIAINLAPDVPMGISVFANAVDQLMDCDNIFDSLNSEFVLGRKRIMVKPEAISSLDGEPLFDANDLVFYILPEDSQNGSTVQEIAATLRVEQHVSGFQIALDLLGLKCGFGPNHWKFDAGHITTATQIISANSEEYRTQQKHQLVLESLLLRFARTMLRLGRDFLNLKLDPDIPISVDFDQSTVENAGEEFDRDIQMLEHGIISAQEFREKWMNEDSQTAESALEDVKKEPGSETPVPAESKD